MKKKISSHDDVFITLKTNTMKTDANLQPLSHPNQIFFQKNAKIAQYLTSFYVYKWILRKINSVNSDLVQNNAAAKSLRHGTHIFHHN